jgi:flagellar biosynthetic protein FliO
MQVRVLARSILIFAIALAGSGTTLAQTGQIASGPLPATPQAGATPSTATVNSTPPVAAEAPLAAPSSGLKEMALPMIKTVGGIGLVISLVLVGYMMFRRFAPQYMGKNAKERVLKLIETLPMGDKRSIMLVQAGGRRLLLASTPGQITLLTAIADTAGAVPRSTVEAADAELPAAASFRNLFELEKRAGSARPGVRPVLPPDIRGKMQELRKSLEG